MAIRYRAAHYLVMIDGAFTDDGVWYVDIVLLVDPPPGLAAHEEVIRDAKRAIRLGVNEETRRGRELGARTIRIRRTPDVRRARLQSLRPPEARPDEDLGESAS